MKRNLIIICSIFFAIYILFWGYRIIGSFYFLQKSHNISQGVSLFDVDYQSIESEEIKNAENFVSKANSLFALSSANLELARLKYLGNNFDDALSIFENSILPNSENPLLYLEAGLVLSNVCERDKSYSNNCYYKNEHLINQIKKFVNFQNMKKSAEEYFLLSNFSKPLEILSILHYISPSSLGEKEKNILLLCATKSGLEIDQKNLDRLKIKVADNNFTIQPENFFWLDGRNVDISGAGTEAHIGKLWVSDYVFTVVTVQESSPYKMEFEFLDAPPAPTQLEIAINLEQTTKFVLGGGDNKLVKKVVTVKLNKGINILTIRLLNDEIVNSIDRNGNIGKIFFEKINK